MGSLNKCLKYLCGGIFLVLIVLSGLQVFFRYALSVPLDWIQEYTLVLFLWFAYLSASVCAFEGRHISVDMLITKLPKKWGLIGELLANVIWIISCIVLVYTSTQVVATSFAKQSVTIVGEIPYWIIQLSVPVGMTLMGLNVLYLSKELIANFIKTSGKVE